MRVMLLQPQKYAEAKLNIYPLRPRKLDFWEEGKFYDARESQSFLLCNVKIKNEMKVSYIMEDEEFFILVEPDYTKNRVVKVLKKAPLRSIETHIDKSEPRNMLVAFKIFTEENNIVLDEVTLFFENAAKCGYAKRCLDDNKSISKQYTMTVVESFLDASQNLLDI